MIIFWYLARHIYKGSALVLMILISLSLFYTMVRELNSVGNGNYGLIQMFEYLMLRIPAMVVEFVPLSVLLGCVLGLGNLASGSEIIAMQSSGLSIKRLLISVGASALFVALISLLLSNYVVPESETYAKEFRTSNLQSRLSVKGRSGVWIKDENNLIHIQILYPDGHASGIKIYQLNTNKELTGSFEAEKAKSTKQGWLLQQVKQTEISDSKVSVHQLKEWVYKGQLSNNLLESLATDPNKMSLTDLSAYINFLSENSLNHKAESLSLWRKIYSPLSIVVMAMMAIPFVLGSQRQSNTGQRVMTGILLGLLYVVINRLLIQMGEQLNFIPFINALIPTITFAMLTAWLIRRKIVAR